MRPLRDVTVFKPFLSTIWFGRWSNVRGRCCGQQRIYGSTSTFSRDLENKVIVGFFTVGFICSTRNKMEISIIWVTLFKRWSTGLTNVISIPVDLYGSTKSSTQLNVGASPELDLAIGTLCYVARPDVPCIVQGSNGVQYTWETRTVTYNGIQHVESSHPIF